MAKDSRMLVAAILTAGLLPLVLAGGAATALAVVPADGGGDLALFFDDFEATAPGTLRCCHEQTGSAHARMHRLRWSGRATDRGPRRIWWNSVHTSREIIERAKRDWADGAFNRVPEDNEFITLPDA